MAESVREVERNRNNKIRLMSENGDFLSGNREKQVGATGANDLNELFYIGTVRNGEHFGKYTGNDDRVNRASEEFCPDVDDFSSDYKGICPRNDENCRKKRCSDRYDSSESSDSGIAVSSSASSGTSDITDPGSPFSTSSDDSTSSPGKCKVGKRCKSEEKSPSWSQPTGRCRSEEKTWTESWEGNQPQQQQQQQSNKTESNFIASKTDYKMAPNVPSSASSPCDLWTSIRGNNTANDTAHYNHFDKTQGKAIETNKRLKVDEKESIAPLNINNNIVVNVPSPIISEIETDLPENKKKNKSDNCEAPKVKMRRSSCDGGRLAGKEVIDTTKPVKNGVKTCEKSVGHVAKPKQDRSRHQGKITEYFKSQIKSLVGLKRDFGLKKDGQKEIGAILSEDEPSVKRSKMSVDEKQQQQQQELDVPIFVKPSPRPPQTVMPFAEPNRLLSHLSKVPKAADFLLGKPTGTKTLFNKILQNHKNRKLAESYLKCRMVSKPKATADPEVSKSKNHAPYEPSTRNGNNNISSSNSTVLSSATVEDEPSSNLDDVGDVDEEDEDDEKVQNNTELESNLLNVVSKSEQTTDSLSNCNREVISNPSKRNDGLEAEFAAPILSVPKTIRFPAARHDNRVDKHRNPREVISCRWDACSVQSDSASGLLEHLQTAHVLTQVSGEKFVCLWVGCKVFDQKSCSRTWLERHVLSHAGNKPYRCIVDGCGQGFSTQAILERHVNSHFAADVKKALDNSIVHKLFRRNGKKLRYRRQPWSARMFDFFDSGIMEGLEHRLVKLTRARTGGDITEIPGKSLALTSQVVARRMTENGKQQFLLRWFPPNIIEDEWVYENEVTKKKTVSIPNLSPSVSSSLQETLELVTRSSMTYRTGRRKNKGVTVVRQEPLVVVEEAPQPVAVEEPEALLVEQEKEADVVEEPKLPKPKKVPVKKVKAKTKKKKIQDLKVVNDVKAPEPNLLPPTGVPLVDIATEASLTTEKTVSLRPKETPETPVMPPVPEEMTVVPVCPPVEEIVPVQTGGLIVDNSMAPMKTEMIVSSPLKLVTSQYIEQPFVQTVMPVQMPVTYQIPIVKLSQTAGMFFPQIPNYIIPQSPAAVLPTSPMPALRNGFHFSTGGTIQFQASSTTLQQTPSGFMQSTNSAGFQIVHSPAATAATNIQQSVVTAFQNCGIANLNLKSPTLRLLNCQPLILNNAKPLTNVSLTLTNLSSGLNGTNGLPMPTLPAGMTTTLEPNPTGRKILAAASTTSTVTPLVTPTKKLVKQKLNILPKPNHISPQKGGVGDGGKNKKQCLQPCRPATGTAS